MGTKLNKITFESEIKLHIEELCKHMKKNTLERRFIIHVLEDSVKCYYPEYDGKHHRQITEKELKLAAKELKLKYGLMHHIINKVRDMQSKSGNNHRLKSQNNRSGSKLN